MPPKILAAVLALLLAAGCAAQPTPYRPANGDETGYRTTQIEANRFRVSFAGNADTSREQVENLLLYHAARVTLENGGDHFVVVARDVDRESEILTAFEPLPPPTHAPWAYHPYRAWGMWAPYYYHYPHLSRTIDYYTASAEIVTGKGPPPADPKAYDAHEVMARLAPLVETVPAAG